MASRRPGPGRVAGGHNNNQIPIGMDQGMSTMDKFLMVIDSNKKLQITITRLNDSLSKVSDENVQLKAEKQKLNKQVEKYEHDLVESLQNYENAKVVVLTYKTRNIHLDNKVQELEEQLKDLEEKRKSAEHLFQNTNAQVLELKDRLHYAEDKASKAQQEVNRLQQFLHGRSEEIDKLKIGVRNIAEHCQLSPDQLQWMMGEAWNQQQHSRQSLLQQCDQLSAELHDKNMLITDLEHQLRELQSKKAEAETYRRIKGKNMSTEKIETLAAKLDNAQICIDDYKKDIDSKTEQLARKDASIKGLQEILKKEQQSRQEKLAAMQAEYTAQNQKLHELNKLNENLHNKVGELSEKCEDAQTEYAILKSVDLQSREELQKYKERVISLEREIRKCKQNETDLYSELDAGIKDLEELSKKYRSLQNENTTLKLSQSTANFNGTDDPPLLKELNHKNTQIEILHGQVRSYSDNLDREKRRVAMLTMDNQKYQQQLQQLQRPPPLPPRSPNFSSINKTQPLVNSHQAWEGLQPPMGTVLSRDTGSNQLMPERPTIEPKYYSEAYKQYDSSTGRVAAYPFNVHPQNRLQVTPHHSDPRSDPGPSEPCPLCGKTFSTTAQLTVHASSCTNQ